MRGKVILILAVLVFGILCGGCGKTGLLMEGSGDSVTELILNEEGKEEIQLCISVLNVTMREVIADYNRQSDRYEVVALEFDGNTSIDDWRNRIQLDLTGGKGADILDTTALQRIDMRPYAESGLFMDVTDFVAGQGGLVDAAAEANRIEGRQYGIPYSFTLNTMVTSPQMATDRENWTAEYCMWRARENNASVFIGAPGGWDRENAGLYVLNVLGVGMGGIQLFVDGEQGVSAFECQEFMDMLEFAKKYADPVSGESTREKLVSGGTFCTTVGIKNFSGFWYCDALFEGEPVYMGYPSPRGGVHQVEVSSLYINAASSHKEGVLDFMQFLLAEEQQRKLTAGYGAFPVNQKLLDTLWQEAKEEAHCEDTGYERNGIFYSPRLMTDEEERIFWEMLEEPIYYQWQNDIWDIIWDEVLPYFYGEKAAGDVAKAVDSRVQLYLDERK